MSDNEFEKNDDFVRGLETRIEVLGEAHVTRSLERAKEDPFLLVMQQVTTEFGWGKIWSRPGLPRKTRSFLAMTCLAALGKPDEFRTHVRGAVNNGATREEIAEVLLQAAVYCGFPVGLESFRLAKQVFDELDAERG